MPIERLPKRQPTATDADKDRLLKVFTHTVDLIMKELKLKYVVNVVEINYGYVSFDPLNKAILINLEVLKAPMNNSGLASVKIFNGALMGVIGLELVYEGFPRHLTYYEAYNALYQCYFIQLVPKLNDVEHVLKNFKRWGSLEPPKQEAK